MKLTVLPMVLMLMVSASGCMDDSLPPATVATATIQNNLEVDGCAYLVTIEGVRYAPDAASRAAIDDNQLPPTATVTVAYRRTGKVGQVQCEPDLLKLPEISLELAHVDGRP
ncbi:MAG: hypothetical protein ABIY55_00785 [Kofleriaceae bacterium]